VTVYEYRCPEHPDSVQHFHGRYGLLIACHWVTRDAAGELQRCGRILTPMVLPSRG
jgi:hypothetical protein